MVAYVAKTFYICAVKLSCTKMKWSELRRIAEKNGWYLVRHGGGHDVYAHADKNYQIEIERHGSKEVKTGIYYKLKKQIGF
ncbi:MAG: type II toxin-antitoxin system HicA family toxin [Prevotellaceae bacterium]|jgi:predicted RNA binding protein YcfA (HicA-like mRNA interferase family)|nr:type II toxin-antitoxin system HicA family toxin [Prevotellaceae bacterium]